MREAENGGGDTEAGREKSQTEIAKRRAERGAARENEKKGGRKGVLALAVGAAVCIAGLIFMLVQLFAEPGLADAEFLVSSGSWVREDEPSVIWNFTEVGKGQLTTNSHKNDYDFIWAISGDKLQVETEWLYTFSNEFLYKLDQEAKTLTLSDGEKEIVFRVVESET